LIPRLNNWARSVLADPVTKLPKKFDDFKNVNGVPDARVYLKNSIGFTEWSDGQTSFEDLEVTKHYSKRKAQNFEKEIQNDALVYKQFKLKEPILDVGGSCGLLREFLTNDKKYLVVDPFIDVHKKVSFARQRDYKCLSRPLNFVAGVAEFLPIQSNSFETVHMRSMLDHVQIVDLCLLEAKRVLRSNGLLIIGVSIEGRPYGKSGKDLRFSILSKKIIKSLLILIGFKRFKDEHVWHPTYENLIKVITDNGFRINKIYWQPSWKGKVVYISARNVS